MAEYINPAEGEPMTVLERETTHPVEKTTTAAGTAFWLTNGPAQVSWPVDWTERQKVNWLAEQYGIDPTAARPATFYVSHDSVDVDFDWNDINPADHVLMSLGTFETFLDACTEAAALAKGMKTVNRKRRKANQVLRRTERRLTQAREGREQLRRQLERAEEKNARLDDRLTVSRAAVDAWRRSYSKMYDADNQLIDQLRTKIQELTVQLETLTAPPIEEEPAATPE